MTLAGDLRLGMRLLVRSPGFTAIAALSLGLGIGINTLIFSGVNSILLKEVPVNDPARLVAVHVADARNPDLATEISRPNFQDFRSRNRVFEDLTAYQHVPLALSSTTGEPEVVIGVLVAGNYFDVLGVKPILGRAFLPDEDKTPGTHLVAVLSYDAWQRRFGGDRAVVGRTITLNRQPFSIVGVAPQGFRGLNPFARPIAWLPSMTYRQVLNGFELENFDDRRALIWRVAGRLKPGISVASARADMVNIARQLEQEYPNDNRGRTVGLATLAEDRVAAVGRNQVLLASGMLMTIVGLVLLVACANVANLLLARAAARRREIAVRLALGATRGQIVRQLLAESFLLAVTGGLFALPLANWGQRLLLALRPPFLPADMLDLSPDWRVLVFTAGVTVLAGLAFGLVPALRASRPDLVTEIKEGAADPVGSHRWFGLRNLLVVGQVALSLVALITASLFVRSLVETLRVDPGFEARRLATLTLRLGTSGYDEARGREFHRELLARVAGVPGVEAAALADWTPLIGGGLGRTVYLRGQDRSDPRSGKMVQLQDVSASYLKTMGIPLVRGRGFLDSDAPTSPRVVIVNETMARTFWPGKDPIGEVFWFHGIDEPNEVVGVARDSDYNGVAEERQPFIYTALSQVYAEQVSLIVRSARPASTLGTVQREVQRMDRQLPLLFATTMSEAIRQSLFLQRFGAGLLGFFGGLAFVLAIVGVYGVMAYSVSRRTRELGIRMALGASRPTMVREVLGQGARLAVVGAVIGVAVSLLLARVVSSLLYGVGAADPVTFIGVPAALVVAALTASYLPARRAAAIDPLVALRHE